MNQYIKEIISTTILNENETNNLIYSYIEGNQEAKKELIIHNLRMVLFVASQFAKTIQEPVEDLIWIGVEGLIKAIDSYIPNDKCKFSSYSFRCISNCLKNYYKHLNFSKRKANNISLNTPAIKSDKSDEVQLLNVLKNNEESVENLVIKNMEIEQLPTFLNQLNPQYKLILMLRYGLYNGKCYNLSEIAKLLKVTRQCITQKETKALKKLKKMYDITSY